MKLILFLCEQKTVLRIRLSIEKWVLHQKVVEKRKKTTWIRRARLLHLDAQPLSQPLNRQTPPLTSQRTRWLTLPLFFLFFLLLLSLLFLLIIYRVLKGGGGWCCKKWGFIVSRWSKTWRQWWWTWVRSFFIFKF